MRALCYEVQKYVSPCEDVQSLLARGDVLTADEKGAIPLSACDLLVTVVQTTIESRPQSI